MQRCEAVINNKLAICHPELCLTAFAEIYDFEQNVPMRAGSQEKQQHGGQSGVQEILKRVQDDINIFLKRTYSHINLFTYSPYKKAAFTLAEVLVTLGIIGVVSAMTVPTLMQNHQRKVYVTQLHKVYNTLSQGLLNFQNDRNAVNLKEAGLVSFGFTNFFKTYFNVVQGCGEDAVPCFAEAYKKISGNNTDFTCQGDCVALADGTAIGVTNSTGLSDRIQFVVDINGAAGPNIFGRDAFSLFLYTNNGVIDDLSYINDAGEELDSAVTVAPLSEEQREKGFEEACIAANARFHGCFGKLLNDNWEMTY